MLECLVLRRFPESLPAAQNYVLPDSALSFINFPFPPIYRSPDLQILPGTPSPSGKHRLSDGRKNRPPADTTPTVALSQDHRTLRRCAYGAITKWRVLSPAPDTADRVACTFAVDIINIALLNKGRPFGHGNSDHSQATEVFLICLATTVQARPNACGHLGGSTDLLHFNSLFRRV